MAKIQSVKEMQAYFDGLIAGPDPRYRTKVIDHGWDNYVKQLEIIERERPSIKIGVHQDAGYHRVKGRKTKFIGPKKRKKNAKAPKPMVTVAQIAFWNEFGTYWLGKEHIPPRPFLRSTIDENLKKYDRINERLMTLTFLGLQDVWSSINILGLQIESDIKRKITTLKIPKNAPSTIRAKKGVDNPLIDQGQLRNSIRYVAGKKGEI